MGYFTSPTDSNNAELQPPLVESTETAAMFPGFQILAFIEIPFQ